MTREEILEKNGMPFIDDRNLGTFKITVGEINRVMEEYKDQELREYAEEIKAFEKRMGLDEDEYDSIAEHFQDMSDCLKSREHGYNQVIQDLKQEVNELQKEVQRLKDLKA